MDIRIAPSCAHLTPSDIHPSSAHSSSHSREAPSARPQTCALHRIGTSTGRASSAALFTSRRERRRQQGPGSDPPHARMQALLRASRMRPQRTSTCRGAVSTRIVLAYTGALAERPVLATCTATAQVLTPSIARQYASTTPKNAHPPHLRMQHPPACGASASVSRPGTRTSRGSYAYSHDPRGTRHAPGHASRRAPSSRARRRHRSAARLLVSYIAHPSADSGAAPALCRKRARSPILAHLLPSEQMTDECPPQSGWAFGSTGASPPSPDRSFLPLLPPPDEKRRKKEIKREDTSKLTSYGLAEERGQEGMEVSAPCGNGRPGRCIHRSSPSLGVVGIVHV
ncbi:hypothetical protein C8F04DRAFT_1324562 [Mycena alexandri]|uniref:Uncharacterized protein n=1 Tax=Mycena alexandri TaxID=1745969 RepID=A0AAD6S0J8_9AGAR|nr:hypothetical protein C8F04DRAFT_1324562 [Mycena alexandri]